MGEKITLLEQNLISWELLLIRSHVWFFSNLFPFKHYKRRRNKDQGWLFGVGFLFHVPLDSPDKGDIQYGMRREKSRWYDLTWKSSSCWRRKTKARITWKPGCLSKCDFSYWFWWWEEKIQVDFSDLQAPNTQFSAFISHTPCCPVHPATAVWFSYYSEQSTNKPLLVKPEAEC